MLPILNIVKVIQVVITIITAVTSLSNGQKLTDLKREVDSGKNLG